MKAGILSRKSNKKVYYYIFVYYGYYIYLSTLIMNKVKEAIIKCFIGFFTGEIKKY